MEFSFTQEQDDIRKLAREIFKDLAAADKLPDFEAAVEWYDEPLWKALAAAGLVGVALPESVGGMGMGVLELAVLCEQAGVFAAPIPLVWTTVAAGAIARFGSPEQIDRLLAGVADGSALLSMALEEPDSMDPEAPAARLVNGRLQGTKICVPVASRSRAVLVPARTDSGVVVAIVDPNTDGVELQAQEVTTGELRYRMSFNDVVVSDQDIIAGGADVLAWIVDHTIAMLCATELGVASQALKMTAKYTGEREQFGKAIATFQAVAQRAADAYVDVESIRVATWQSVWRLAEGKDARRELDIAKFWAAEAGHRACYAAQHLHGGIGVDKDYPLHRYYLLSRQLEITLGGAKAHLEALGERIAAEGVTD
ncbi:MAG: alkylation response protein AidB-like acyl-CoA dehydrogenase [Hyphomicrobiaceae bacterium]|jgi:alkylation response protein AidB-like acyl-CoA dehydrogenase